MFQRTRSLNLIYHSLATDTEYVRSRLAQYANDLISLGVDGFRLDAAKRTFYLVFTGILADRL